MNITGKTFKDKKERLAYMVTHKKELIEFKKSAIKYCDGALWLPDNKSIVALKTLETSTKDDTDEIIKRTVIGNTYNWLDSHGDVHVGNNFSKSIKERAGKIWHLHDHEQKMTAKVGEFTELREDVIKWKDLGVDKAGNTLALVGDSDVMKAYNVMMFNQYLAEKVDQHSVGMYYIKLDFAVNDPEFKEEFKEWNLHFDKLGNPEEAEAKGFFWAVKEAKLIEISAVLQGSNSLTPTVDAKNIEPSSDTQKNEPPKSTRPFTYY